MYKDQNVETIFLIFHDFQDQVLIPWLSRLGKLGF